MAIAKANGLAALAKIRDRIQEVKASLVPELAQRLGAAFIKEVADEFRESRDPYGNPWAPLKRDRARNVRANSRRAAAGKATRASKPLIDTGRLRASVSAAPSGSVVRVFLPVQYASYHQYGTSRIPRRQILPEADTGGLGARWSKTAQREADALLKKHFGGTP